MLTFETGSNECTGPNNCTVLIFWIFLIAEFWCLHKFVVNLGQNSRLKTQKSINAKSRFSPKKNKQMCFVMRHFTVFKKNTNIEEVCFKNSDTG